MILRSIIFGVLDSEGLMPPLTVEEHRQYSSQVQPVVEEPKPLFMDESFLEDGVMVLSSRSSWGH